MSTADVKGDLRHSIDFIESNLNHIKDFSLYSYVSGDSDRTHEISVIIAKTGLPQKRVKIDENDIKKYFATCVKKGSFPSDKDKTFQKVVALCENDDSQEKISREHLLFLLKRQYAGLEMDYWITKSVKYKIPHPDKPAVCIKQTVINEIPCTIIGSMDMKEDGLVLTIEDKLTGIIEDKFGEKSPGTETIPLSEKDPMKNDPEQASEEGLPPIEAQTIVDEPESEAEPCQISATLSESDESPSPIEEQSKSPAIRPKMGLFGPTFVRAQSSEASENEPAGISAASDQDSAQTSQTEKGDDSTLSQEERQAIARRRLAERRRRQQ